MEKDFPSLKHTPLVMIHLKSMPAIKVFPLFFLNILYFTLTLLIRGNLEQA